MDIELIQAGYEILTPIDGLRELQDIERAARICYRSKNAITEDGKSAKKMVKTLLERGHEAMLEHSFLSVRFTCDRGVTHELVRHRLCSFAQESTRYCNYAGGKAGKRMRFILPCFFMGGKDREAELELWTRACARAANDYAELLRMGASPQEARSVLPHSLAVEIVMSGNYREWRHILKLRTAKETLMRRALRRGDSPMEIGRRIADDARLFGKLEMGDYADLRISNPELLPSQSGEWIRSVL